MGLFMDMGGFSYFAFLFYVWVIELMGRSVQIPPSGALEARRPTAAARCLPFPVWILARSRFPAVVSRLLALYLGQPI